MDSAPTLRGITVLVTGATGFIGSHLVERLLSEGASVRCLLRSVSPRGGAARHLPAQGAKGILGDLITGAGLETALDGVHIVFHVAGVTKALHASDYYLGNVQATENLLRAMSNSSARLIHVSSLAAMGPSPDGTPLCEDAAPHPLTHYGKSKLEGEQAVRSSALSGRATVIRPPVVYGPRDIDVYQVFKAAASGALVRIGRLESYFSFIYIADLVDGLILAAQCQQASGKAYFLANPGPVSWTEFSATAALTMVKKIRTFTLPVWAAFLAGCFADLLSRLTGRPGILSRDKILDARQRYWICDATRAAADLGFHTQTSLREGVAATLEWYRQAQWLTY
jgi:nucleoside-diphosphate-sugar epimerase